ncbi:hypothetical protein [Actinokineospora pegani]|uniref:hypothetical protein n=1 Tax=Actinokineospora pegani TaxID=2654637 RepID=UPI0012EA0D6A|nr:hypothetical protein [Actinokineospora pegani]
MHEESQVRFTAVSYGWADATDEHSLLRLEQHWSSLETVQHSLLDVGDAYADFCPALEAGNPATLAGRTITGGLVDLVKAARRPGPRHTVVCSLDYTDLPRTLLDHVAHEFGVTIRDTTLQSLMDDLQISVWLFRNDENQPFEPADG